MKAFFSNFLTLLGILLIMWTPWLLIYLEFMKGLPLDILIIPNVFFTIFLLSFPFFIFCFGGEEQDWIKIDEGSLSMRTFGVIYHLVYPWTYITWYNISMSETSF